MLREGGHFLLETDFEEDENYWFQAIPELWMVRLLCIRGCLMFYDKYAAIRIASDSIFSQKDKSYSGLF